MGIGDIAVSAGAACTSASVAPSHVLKAIGVPDDLAHASIRFSVGRYTTPEEIDYACEKVISVVRRLREMSPLSHADSGEEDADVETLWRVK
jgi:cysteine desulfurase